MSLQIVNYICQAVIDLYFDIGISVLVRRRHCRIDDQIFFICVLITLGVLII